MSGLFDERRLPGFMGAKGFLAAFGNPAAGSKTYYVNHRESFRMEIIKGKKRIAQMIPRGMVTGALTDIPIKKGGKSTLFDRTFPLAHEEDIISVGETMQRLPGEPEGTSNDSEVTKQNRMNILASGKHEDQIRNIWRLFEYLASQSFLKGEMPAILDTVDTNLIYDFKRNPDNTIAVDDEWNDGGDILGTIDTQCDRVIYNGRGSMNLGYLMGQNVWPIYLADEDIQTYHDNRNYALARVSMNEPLPAEFARYTGTGGFEHRGKLITPKGRVLQLFSYGQDYENEAGETKLFMPEDQAVCFDPMMVADRYFGPGEQFWSTRLDEMWMQDRFGFGPMNLPMPDNAPSGDIFDPRMFHFYAYEESKKFVTMITQAAPVFVTTQTDAVSTATGLVKAA